MSGEAPSPVGNLPELIEQILRWMEPLEITRHAQLVCRQWHALAHGSEIVWKDRVDPSLLKLNRGLRRAPQSCSRGAKQACSSPPQSMIITKQESSLLRLYCACHAFNFLRSPEFSGTTSWAPSAFWKKPWEIRNTGAGHAVFESPPQGVHCREDLHCFPPPPSKPYPASNKGLHRMMRRLAQPEFPGCLATPQDWVEMKQIIDIGAELQARGLTPTQADAVLSAGLPLGLSIMVAAHHAHAATFAVGLLLDDGRDPSPNLQRFVLRESSFHWWSGKKHLQSGSGWARFAKVVAACPPGFRRAMVVLRGRQSTLNPEPGPFGVKFASAGLEFLDSQSILSFRENAESFKWKRVQDEELD